MIFVNNINFPCFIVSRNLSKTILDIDLILILVMLDDVNNDITLFKEKTFNYCNKNVVVIIDNKAYTP